MASGRHRSVGHRSLQARPGTARGTKHSGGFIGEVGATITGHITVSDIRNNVGQFMSTLITMKSDSGDTIKMVRIQRSRMAGWRGFQH